MLPQKPGKPPDVTERPRHGLSNKKTTGNQPTACQATSNEKGRKSAEDLEPRQLKNKTQPKLTFTPVVRLLMSGFSPSFIVNN